MFLQLLMFIRQVSLRSVLSVTICILINQLDKGVTFWPTVSNGFHDVLVMFIDINSIAILNIHTVMIILVLLMKLAKVKP